ncbi:MAG: dipeptidase [Pseudomonadota bacterium]|nr:dipeptidase [Pseudomonadota bacterium]
MSDYKDAILIDGLVIARFSRALFEDMAKGGITTVHCTCSVWHDFRQTMANIAQWLEWFEVHDDIIMPVRTAADIKTAKQTGKVGVILGWQNSSAIDNDVANLRLFHQLGIRVVQLTYNTQNLVGAGCWEPTDPGLSNFGRNVVEELNHLGMLIDLSHVGPQTSADAIAHSKAPVAYTHCCPMLKQHARNKTDDQLKAIADRGGFVGFASYTPFLPQGADATLDDCVTAMTYMIDLVGEEAVGIGTDWVQDQDIAFFEYLTRNMGSGQPTTPIYDQVPPMPKGLETLGDFGNFIPAMERAGWSEVRIRRVLGENWLRFLGEVWRPH